MFPIDVLRLRKASSGGTQRQLMILTLTELIYVNTSASADKQYALPSGAYPNEQS